MKYASYRSVFKMYEYIQPFLKYSSPLEEKLQAGKVLVIAPHQDDESIGCGGSLIKFVKDGGHLEIAFCTTGESERMNETKKATQILGSKTNHFFQFEIRSLYSNINKLADCLSDLLFYKIKPDIIFMPFMIDNHQDHVSVSKAFCKAYQKTKIDCLIYAYSVWQVLIPNVIIDVSEEWEQKKAAIECYKTQTVSRDYVTMASSIAQYWAQVKGKDTKYCESFFKISSGKYVDMVRKIL